MKDLQKEVLPGGTIVFVNETHRVCTDALLLAAFSFPKLGGRVCELGAGCGIIPLKWHDMGFAGSCTGIELNEEAAGLFSLSLEKNGISSITCLRQDLRSAKAQRPFDSVVCNPPYFTAGAPSPSAGRQMARHETACTLADVTAAAGRLLKNGGRFFCCIPPVRLASLFYEMKAARLEPKRLRFVRQAPLSPAPFLALVEGKKGGGEGLVLEGDFFLQEDPAGQKTF